MKNTPKRLWVVLALLSFAGILRATLPQTTVGTWTSASNLGQARANAAAVMLSDSRILITGGDAGSGPLQSAEIFGTNGSASAAGAMNVARSGHFAVVLSDGRVLAGGGNSSGGGATNSAEIYDPSSDTWTQTSSMTQARAGATAALLQDGRVLIAGGDNSGTPSNTIEVFDPSSGEFSFAGTLSSPRTKHAMAVLQDGRVLIVGGSDGTNPLASSDIYDPSSGNVTAGPALSTARYSASATTLLDGRIVVIGGAGREGADLASAEIYDPASGAFSNAGAALATAREGHQAFLLPNNNSVLIVGGTSGATTVAASELFIPQISSAGVWSSSFSASGANVTARSAAVGSSMKQPGLLLAAGGNDASGNGLASTELYAFPTVKTDQADYAPGTVVTITGSGWQPGETVSLSFVESPLDDTHPTLTAVADANGNISNNQFSPDIHDISIRFYLTAVGSQSGLVAGNTFTDGNVTSLGGTVRSSATGNPVISGATITCTSGCNNNPAASTTSGATGVYVFNNTTTKLSFNTNGPVTLQLTASATGFNSSTITIANVNNGDTLTGKDFTLTPAMVNTTTTVISSADPSVFGQSVTFTASVTPASGTTASTGSIQFVVDNVNFGSPVTLINGSATSQSTATLSVGGSPHSVKANYTHTGNFNDSIGTLTNGQTVNKSDSTTLLTADHNPSVFGQSVTFTVTVSAKSPGSGTPTGTVDFKDGSTTIASGVALSGGQATFSTATLTVATHSITVVYNSDGNFNTSASSALSQVVNKADTQTALTFSANPSVFGQSVTFTATVTAVAPGTGTPTGTVTFKDGTTTLGTGTLNGSGVATFSTSALAVGNHTITTNYGGDGNFNGSTGSLTGNPQVVNRADTTTTVTSSQNPSVFGQSVTLTATVGPAAPGAGTPTGTVTFLDGGNPIGTSTLNGSGVATFSTSALAVGNHTVTTSYGGDGNFNGSTGSLTGNPQVVNRADTTTTVTSSQNPSVFGQSVTLTATVGPAAPGAGTPTGTVTFLDGGSPIGTGTLSGGIATFTSSALAVGNHTINTSYGGDVNFNGSTGSLTGNPQVVNKANSSTTVTSSVNPSVFGQSITFTAAVSPVAPGAGTPTGTVTFLDGGNPIGTGTLSGGIATFTSSALAVGNHTITTSYGGDANFNGSTGSLTGNPQVVNKADTTTTVTSSVNPSVFGQSITFTAKVYAVAPGSGTATGTVTFLDGGNPIGTGTLSGGIATFTTSALSVGNHTITTSYGGDGNFNGSTGSLTGNPQVVNKADTTTTVTSSVNPSVFGQSITFTAKVYAVAPGSGTATGTVTFLDGGSPIGTGTLNGSGVATFSTSALAVGNHTITTSYGGDGNFNGSTGSLTGNPQVVNKADTSTTATSSQNPSVFGQSVTFTATVLPVAPGAGTPTGTVTFFDGGNPIGTGTISGGMTFMTSSLAVGSHNITASYNGDGNFKSSTSGTVYQTVNKASTSTGVASSKNPSLLGDSVTFTATVSVTAPGAGTPTGTVQFMDGASPLGSPQALNGALQATFTTSSLSVGAHNITATYSGDGNFNGSTSSTLTQNVQYNLCLLYDPARSVKSGATYPLKIYLCAANGSDVSSSAIVVHATSIFMASGFSGPAEDAGNANPDMDFRYDPTLGPSGGYIFNLQTKGLGGGTYGYTFTVTGDPLSHSLATGFGVK